MHNWYTKFIKNSQAATPTTGQSEAQTEVGLRNEKQAMLTDAIGNFIAQVAVELNNQMTPSKANLMAVIQNQIDPQGSVPETKNTELIQRLTGEVARKLLEGTTHGVSPGSVAQLIHTNVAPVSNWIMNWMNSYRNTESEVSQVMQKNVK